MDHLIDARDLPAPKPLELTLDTLADMAAGDRLLLRNRRQPFPLYDILRRMGYRWEVSGCEGDYSILIEPADRAPGTH